MADTKRTADSGEAEVQSKFDEAQKRGFHGDAVDETPREAYTVAGSIRRAGENLDTK